MLILPKVPCQDAKPNSTELRLYAHKFAEVVEFYVAEEWGVIIFVVLIRIGLDAGLIKT